MRTARAVVLALATFAAAACGGDGGDGAAPDEEPAVADEAGDRDAEIAFAEHLAGVLDDDGVLPADAALQLFSASIEELPGVEVGDAVAELAAEEAYEPDMALRAAVELLPTLEPDAAAIVRRVAYGEDDRLLAAAREVDVGADGAGTDDSASAPVPSAAELALGEQAGAAELAETDRERVARGYAGLFTREISSHLGRPLTVPIAVVELSRGEAERTFRPNQAAQAIAVGDTGVLESCLVRLNPNPIIPLTEPERVLKSQIAHEVFHCFQYALFPGDVTAASLWPMWVKEGSAAWAGETLVEGSAQSSTWWLNWLVFSDRPLLRRTYDAIGFWSLLDATGVDTWRRLDAVMRDIPRAYEIALGAEGDALLARWGSSLARDPGVGEPWDTYGPGVTGEEPDRVEVPLTVDGDPTTLRSVVLGDRTGRMLELDAEGDVLTIAVNTFTARVHVPGAPDAVLAPGGAMGWCLDPGGCVCPDGSRVPGPAGDLVPAEAGRTLIGAASSTSGGGLTVSARSLEEACDCATGDAAAGPTARLVSTGHVAQPTTCGGDEPPVEPAGGACLVGAWTGGPWVVPAGDTSGGNGVRLVLEADGTGTVDFGGMQPAILAAPDGGPPVQTNVLFEGSGAVTWRADDATVTITYTDPGAFRATSRVVFDGAPVSEQSKSFAEVLSGGGVPPLSSAPYTCGDGGFRLVMPVPGGTGTFELPFTGG